MAGALRERCGVVSRRGRRSHSALSRAALTALVSAAVASAAPTASALAESSDAARPSSWSTAAALDPPSQHELLWYSVDLEAPPRERFAGVWRDFLKRRGAGAFAKTYEEWRRYLKVALPAVFSGPEERFDAAAAEWFAALRDAHPAVVEEVEALSAVLTEAGAAADPPLNASLFEPRTLATVASLYPLANIAEKNSTDTIPSACTSTLARAPGGAVLHGRSLDYEPRDPLAESTVVVDFKRAGRPLYRCLTPLVYPTALQWFTCIRPGAFSLSVNARGQGADSEHNATFPELLRRLRRPGRGALLLGEVSELAMQASTYDEALSTLATSPVLSSNYFILAGAGGEGAIVTRFGNRSSADVWALGAARSGGGDEEDGQPPWMRVQTNVDHWVDRASGAYATCRRQRVVDELKAIGGVGSGAGVGAEALMGVYLTDSAAADCERRRQPEDTGVVLRPTTIATLILDPAASPDMLSKPPDSRSWRVWRTTPSIRPPEAAKSSASPLAEEVVATSHAAASWFNM